MIGTTVGSYRITQKVSVGGMGTVYRAEHTLIGKPAAVKVLHPELRSNPEVVQRFFNEAKATTQIKHPGIVEIFDFGYLESGDGYIVMEFLEGESLARRLESSGKMPEGEAAVLMRSVCSALGAAHAKGIIHRDLKPDNLFLCPDPDAPTGERPKLLDFGIAKLNTGLTGPQNATKTGAVMGTPTYMSPEQCKGTGDLDARSDLYSLGCMFYEMVTGKPPFDNMTAGELIGAHLFIEPTSPKANGADISDAADALIMQLLAKQPAKRVQTAQELARRFAEIAQGQGLATRQTPIPTANHKVTQAAGIAPTLASDPGLSSSPRISAAGVPSVAPAADSKPVVQVSSQPTTLSGAASQSASQPIAQPRSRAPLFAGLGAAFLIAGGAAFFMVSSTTKSTPSTPVQPATTPEPTPAPTPAPAPAPVAAPEPTPAPVENPEPTPVAPTETPTDVPEVKAVAKTPKKPKPAVKTADKKPADKAKPADKPKPTDKTKPADKPKPASSGSILIETDI
jgi:serine/threonine-protein kinase